MSSRVVALLLAFACVGCGDKEVVPVEEEPLVVEVVEVEPEPPRVDVPSELVGHAWRSAGNVFIFQKGGNLLVRGEKIEKLAPNGAPGRFELDGERLELTVMGQHYVGIWNGERLLISDQEAEYLGPNSDFLD